MASICAQLLLAGKHPFKRRKLLAVPLFAFLRTEPKDKFISPEQLHEDESLAKVCSLIILEILVMAEPQKLTPNYRLKPVVRHCSHFLPQSVSHFFLFFAGQSGRGTGLEQPSGQIGSRRKIKSDAFLP